MKNSFSRWFKICFSCLMTLIAITLSAPINASSKPINQYTSRELYELGFNSLNNKNYSDAAIYLFAYTQLNPPEYVNNPAYRASIDSNLALALGEIQRVRNLLREIDNNLKSCGKYPCNSRSSSLGIIFVEVPTQPLQPPPDAAIVCTDPNYRGYCKLLPIGRYTNFTQMGINDKISSIMVGSQVKLTLYVHARFDSQSITFPSNDSNLSNDRIDNTYFWNDNASAAIVQNK